jgi:hypothetical protein
MKERIRKADLWLLDEVFQPISNWTTDTVGMNCFALAKIAYVVQGALFVGIDEYIHSSSVVMFIDVAITGWFVFNAARTEDTVRRNSLFLNPMRQYIWLRFFCCWSSLFSVPLLIARVATTHSYRPLLGIAVDLIFDAAVYFQCCTPRPPKPKPLSVPATMVMEGA